MRLVLFPVKAFFVSVSPLFRGSGEGVERVGFCYFFLPTPMGAGGHQVAKTETA